MRESKVSQKVEQVLGDYRQQLEVKEGRKVIASHFGLFSQDFVYSICENIESLLISIGDDRIVIKRIFSILIEGLQNIRLHGKTDDSDQQIGYLIIAGNADNYKITMANLIAHQDSDKLQEYLQRINAYTHEELKKTYLSILQREFMSNKGGAGLGFITTRIKSESKLDYAMYPMEESNSLFSFEIKINR